MRPMSIVGIILIVVGLAALAFGGFSYTTRETVVDLGPLQATAERERSFPLPPVAGVTAVAAGVALLVLGMRKRA